jgi:hypothetical protein
MPDNDDIDASGILTLTTQVEFISMDTIPTVFLGVFSISKQFIYGRGNGQLILINEKDNPDFTQKSVEVTQLTDVTVQLEALIVESDFQIFPNPAVDHSMLQTNFLHGKFIVSDIYGRVHLTKTIHNATQ